LAGWGLGGFLGHGSHLHSGKAYQHVHFGQLHHILSLWAV
jgi:hypothetical protein